MKIKVGWLDSSVSREEILELFYSKKNPWWYSKVKISWDENSSQKHIFIHGVPHHNLSGGTWHEFAESLSVLADITKIIKDIKRSKEKFFFVPFGMRHPELPAIVFESGDSLEVAEKLISEAIDSLKKSLESNAD